MHAGEPDLAQTLLVDVAQDRPVDRRPMIVHPLVTWAFGACKRTEFWQFLLQHVAIRVTTRLTVSAEARRRSKAVSCVALHVWGHAVPMTRSSWQAWMPIVP